MTLLRPIPARVCAAAAALLLGVAMLAAPAGAAPKKGKRGPLQVNETVNQLVPGASDTAAGVLRSTITVGKKFKGQTIGDVDATVQTTGAVPGAAEALTARLSAPNGATTTLFLMLGGQSIGPLTLDDESPVQICAATGPFFCTDPAASLVFPYIGTAAPFFSSLRILDRGPVRGTWTLTVLDDFAGGAKSVLNAWGLRITPRRPVR